MNTPAFYQHRLGLYLSPAHLHGFIVVIIGVCGALTVGLVLATAGQVYGFQSAGRYPDCAH